MRTASSRLLFLLVFLLVGVIAQPVASVTEDEVEAACADSAAALAVYEGSQDRFDAATAAFNEVSSELEAVAYRQLGLRALIEEREDEVHDTRLAVRERAVEVYMAGGLPGTEVILATDSVSQFLVAAELLDAVSGNDLAIASELTALANDAQKLREELVATQSQLAELRSRAEDFRADMERALVEASNSYQDLSSECSRVREEYQQQLARERAAAAARAAGAAGGLPPEATPGFICPMSQPIAFINDWGFARSGGRTHKGTDVFSANGHPQVAVADGTVELRSGGLGGTALWIHSDYGVGYYYAHLSAYAQGLSNGQRVTTGDVVGYTGTTGNAVGGAPHLHFGMEPPGGGWVNPYPTLARNC